jgi:hypothetical protein
MSTRTGIARDVAALGDGKTPPVYGTLNPVPHLHQRAGVVEVELYSDSATSAIIHVGLSIQCGIPGT